jgi:hypothetical protein
MMMMMMMMMMMIVAWCRAMLEGAQRAWGADVSFGLLGYLEGFMTQIPRADSRSEGPSRDCSLWPCDQQALQSLASMAVRSQ